LKNYEHFFGKIIIEAPCGRLGPWPKEKKNAIFQQRKLFFLILRCYHRYDCFSFFSFLDFIWVSFFRFGQVRSGSGDGSSKE